MRPLEQNKGLLIVGRECACRRKLVLQLLKLAGGVIKLVIQDEALSRELPVLVEQPLAVPLDVQGLHSVIEVVYGEVGVLLAEEDGTTLPSHSIVRNSITAWTPIGIYTIYGYNI